MAPKLEPGKIVSMRYFPAWLAAAAALLATLGCKRAEDPEETTFYDRKIGPILQGSCVSSPTKSGCHVAADDRGNALGNLNLQSYETLNHRRDLLIEYGPYGMPSLLLRVVPPQNLKLTSWDNEAQFVTTDIAHDAGSLLDVTSVSFNTLKKWIENGAAENNAPVPNPTPALQPCSNLLGSDPLFNPATDPATPDYQLFLSTVNPLLATSCAAGNCHGNPSNSLYLTCGDTPELQRWNYFITSDYVSVEPTQSEILRRTLAPSQGGTYHEGGMVFPTSEDPGYRAILDWATQKGGPSNIPSEPGFLFFAKKVQPMLVKRGCMQANCHSSAMFHDYRLRGGSGGHFGLPATRTNYELTLQEVSLESPDPNASRLIRKNLVPPPAGSGILHRGGPLFAGGGDPTACDTAAILAAPPEDLDTLDPYCVIVTWLQEERNARMGSAAPLSGIVYVKRPPAPQPNTPQDYATFAPGADLLLAPASLDAANNVSVGGAGTSLLGQCGLSPGIDVRRPSVSWDGTKIAFAARTSDSEPLKIYVIDGGSCALEPGIDAGSSGGAELIHNFDPAFAPDGRIVFASTRGNLVNTDVLGSGVTRSSADPSKQNANLYVLEGGNVRQLTFLTNQEIGPSFMSDGRIIMTTEKRSTEFYQLAARRQNLDGGDYHPLFGQRSTIDYNQFTDVVELADQNLAAIMSDKGAMHGAGTLAIVNRSIGVDQLSGDPADYLQDPNAMGWPNPSFYQHSLRIVDGAVSGKPGEPTTGAYRNPASLPNRQLLVSYAPNVVDVGNFAGRFEIVAVDTATGQRSPLISDPSDDLLWPVAVYARQNHGIFTSRLDEANGASRVGGDPSRSEILFLDVPLLSSLIFQNTRTGRIVPPPSTVEIWLSLPPDPGGGFESTDSFGTYSARRTRLGSVALESDGSAHIAVPGGAPIVLATFAKLAGDGAAILHHQREEMQFYPGEVVRQGFRKEQFNGVCAGCHGSLSGFETQISMNPDILTSASAVKARDKAPVELFTIGGFQGPPFP